MSLNKKHSVGWLFVSLIAATIALLLLVSLFDRPPELSLVSVSKAGTPTVSMVLENASDQAVWIDSSRGLLRVYQITTSDGDIVAWRSTDVPGYDRIEPDERIYVKFVADKPPTSLVLVYQSQNWFGVKFDNEVLFSLPTDETKGASRMVPPTKRDLVKPDRR